MTPKQFVKAYTKYGSIKAVSREAGVTWYRARKLHQAAVDAGLMDKQPVGRKSNAQVKAPEPIFHGIEQAPKTAEFEVPERGVRRYICTSAQNNTKVHEGLWRNLLTLREHYSAKLLVARYAYMKSGMGEKGDKAKFTDAKDETLYGADTVAWAPEITEFVNDQRIELAPGLVWCGEWQRLPTTKRPLSGYESYTGRNSGIFPHAKFEMQSVVSSKFEPTKFNYTTGTVTMRNYIVKGAGLQATFHHGYGALLIEVDSDGDWFVRQLNADSDGTLHDLDLQVKDGVVTDGHRIEGVTWGDIHYQQSDAVVRDLSMDVVDTLKPRYAFYHDVLNFGSRNHHERKDPFKRLQRHVREQECVRTEVNDTMNFLARCTEYWPETSHIVVDSNHDRALEQWLRESDWRDDPVNMEFFMESALAKVRAIQQEDHTFHMMRHWFSNMIDPAYPNIKFLDEDESFVICEDANGGIEGGMHGHLGPNGARGGAAAFSKMGRKANVGHSHQAGIYDGVYTAGTSSELDMGYNRGPSSWSHSHVLTYENGKRAIITMWRGKWKAGMKPVPSYREAA